MLPKDMFTLIDNYNEDGVFVTFNGNICWFNGKRIEPFIAESYYCLRILTYNNTLYVSKNAGVLHIYRNKKFQKVDFPTRWNHPLHIFAFSNGIFYNKQTYNFLQQYDHQTYQNKIEVFDGKVTYLLPPKTYPNAGFQLFCYDNYLYCFGFSKNEKFNFSTQRWELFASCPPNAHHNSICFFKNCFYILTDDSYWI